MDKIVKYDSIDQLQKAGDPIIIVAAVIEAEAILKSCGEHNIKISGICDSEKRKSAVPFSGIKVYHTPALQVLAKASLLVGLVLPRLVSGAQ